MNFFYLSLLSFFMLLSCSDKNENHIFIENVQIICANLSESFKEIAPPNAVLFKISSSNKEILNTKIQFINDNFFINDPNEHYSIKISLERIEKVISDSQLYYAYFYINEKELETYFPANAENVIDSCYYIALANMVGEGKLLLNDNGVEKEIMKSKDFKFFIGPNNKKI
jgi:hypothetical protein